MIDIVQYRFRIGTYTGKGVVGGSKARSKQRFAFSSAFNPYNRTGPMKFHNLDNNFRSLRENIVHAPSKDINHSFQLIFYSYIMALFIFIMLSIVLSPEFLSSNNVHPSHPYVNWKFSLFFVTHIKIGYFCIISSIVLKYACLGKPCSTRLRKHYIGSSRFHRVLIQLLLCVLLLNFLLIGIINPSLLNPGPKTLKICYQNVQGLIPFSQLGNYQPSLDRTKILELNAYIKLNKPDIILLNET